jgi:hypothetical protein
VGRVPGGSGPQYSRHAPPRPALAGGDRSHGTGGAAERPAARRTAPGPPARLAAPAGSPLRRAEAADLARDAGRRGPVRPDLHQPGGRNRECEPAGAGVPGRAGPSPEPPWIGPPDNGGAVAVGAHFALAGGSVRSVEEAIGPRVFSRLAARAGGEAASAGPYGARRRGRPGRGTRSASASGVAGGDEGGVPRAERARPGAAQRALSVQYGPGP